MKTFTQDLRIMLDLFNNKMESTLRNHRVLGLPDKPYKECEEALEEGHRLCREALDKCDTVEDIDPLFDLHTKVIDEDLDSELADCVRRACVEHLLDSMWLRVKLDEDEDIHDTDRLLFSAEHLVEFLLMDDLMAELLKEPESEYVH